MRSHLHAQFASSHGTSCVLMFSGGRDSSIAAVRLSQQFAKLVLVTVTSDHLVGYDLVRSRLRELRQHLSPDTLCIRVLQPVGLAELNSLRPTCLPCHRDYVTA